ncbi:DUF6444 domain-containing protein [Kitasatospora aureofaciens]|uniref:DUF6444 domain-containing protein n=1 Tax=Kitasatospora aureofaciens TaxID=1894 RepID=UPI0038254A31
MCQAAPLPSYEELAALVVELRSEPAQARARIANLEARLAQNSTNSSRPPFSLPHPLPGRSGRMAAMPTTPEYTQLSLAQRLTEHARTA